MDLQQFKQDFALLVEAGFIAVKQGNTKAAQELFHAAAYIKPENSAPALGYGYIALHALNLKGAEKIFTDVLAKEPKNAMAKVLLGFTLLMPKFLSVNRAAAAKQNPEEVKKSVTRGRELLKEAVELGGNDPAVRSLASASEEMLAKVETYQKSPA